MRVLPHMGTFVPASPQEILRPAKFWFVLLSIAAGLALNLVPLPRELMTYRPDFLALVLLYWCIQEPRFVGVGTAWLVGLVMDVGDATVFGQHALAYAVLAYGAEYFRRRVLRFPLWQQAVQVALLLALCSLIVLVVRFVGGATLPKWTYLAPALVGACLWPLVSVLLQSPQRPSRSRRRDGF
ncbi:MAG TPA: rod shape-determining protein MreD [Casimicrobiaceae bacterium]|nr:rod shape-determining protein MreD [Casimicrobiaceae bacterium]